MATALKHSVNTTKTNRKHLSRWAAAVASASTLGAALPALADATATVTAPVTATATITMTLSITTSLGTSTDSDVKTVAAAGHAGLSLVGPNPQWTGLVVEDVLLDPADTQFHFDLYCFPIIGCQALNVSLTNFTIASTAPMTSPISATGAVSFPAASLVAQGDYATTGVSTSSGTIVNYTNADFTCRVQSLPKSRVGLDQFTLAPVVSVIDPASLPAGVTALTITIASNLTNFTMVGPWSAGNPFDLDHDGQVSAPDLSILLSQWGGPGSADFDGSGAVGGPDLASLLSAWGT